MFDVQLTRPMMGRKRRVRLPLAGPDSDYDPLEVKPHIREPGRSLNRGTQGAGATTRVEIARGQSGSTTLEEHICHLCRHRRYAKKTR